VSRSRPRAVPGGGKQQNVGSVMGGEFMKRLSLVAAMIAVPLAWGQPGQPANYQQRLQQQYRDLFATYDVDHDGVLTRDEARASNRLAPVFDSMDINRDGKVTDEELARWLADIPLYAR
jgi:EF hand domain-containing protein